MYAGSAMGESQLQAPITAINTDLHQNLRPDIYTNTNIHLALRSKSDTASHRGSRGDYCLSREGLRDLSLGLKALEPDEASAPRDV